MPHLPTNLDDLILEFKVEDLGTDTKKETFKPFTLLRET